MTLGGLGQQIVYGLATTTVALYAVGSYQPLGAELFVGPSKLGTSVGSGSAFILKFSLP